MVSKRELISIILILVAVLVIKACFHEIDAGFNMPPVYIEEAAPDGKFIDSSLVPDDFDWEGIDKHIDSPFGLTINGSDCVDTHQLTEATCDDKAAIIKYRKAKADELTEELKLKVERLEREALISKYGLQEC